MTTSVQMNSQKVVNVNIFRGTIICEGKTQRVIFECHTDSVEAETFYKGINQKSVEEGYPRSVLGRDISNIELISTRSY
jgi:hypothetical protein